MTRFRRSIGGVPVGAVVSLGLAFVPLSATAATPCGPTSAALIDGLITESATRFGLPPRWIDAVMGVESRRQVRAISRKGALGLMQVMPTTYAGLRLRYGLGSDPLDAHDNVLAGAAYLRELYDRFGLRGALAAYNAGPGRWLEYLAHRSSAAA